jgi:DNA invertase Pin-like site-specific DNA recombinase
MAKRAAFYLRPISSATIADQERTLKAVAARSGWQNVATFRDEAPPEVAPGLAEAISAAEERAFDILAIYAIDCLGHSLAEAVTFLSDMEQTGCSLYLHEQALDTSNVAGRAILRMATILADLERRRSALATTPVPSTREAKARRMAPAVGRSPHVAPATRAIILALKKDGMSVRAIAAQCKVSLATVAAVLESGSYK